MSNQAAHQGRTKNLLKYEEPIQIAMQTKLPNRKESIQIAMAMQTKLSNKKSCTPSKEMHNKTFGYSQSMDIGRDLLKNYINQATAIQKTMPVRNKFVSYQSVLRRYHNHKSICKVVMDKTHYKTSRNLHEDSPLYINKTLSERRLRKSTSYIVSMKNIKELIHKLHRNKSTIKVSTYVA